MTSLKGLVAGAVAGLALLAAVPASAAVTFSLTGSDSSETGANGNIYTKTIGSLTVTATAWSTDTTPVAGEAPVSAHLGAYSIGLGVTGPCEADALSCFFGLGQDSHTVDNANRYDFIRLVFSQSVTLDGAGLTAYPTGSDTDAWYSSGNSTSFDTTSWGNYLTAGVNVNNPGGSFDSAAYGTVWLIGASHGSSNDSFKLSSVTVSTAPPAVPEPGVWLMMIVGFGIIGLGMRRREAGAQQAVALLS